MKTEHTNDPVTNRIISLIEKHAAPLSAGRGARESGTLDTLPKRLSLPDAEHVQALIEAGHLKSAGPVNRNEPDGIQRYHSDELDGIRREVFASIAEQVIENWEGDAQDLPAAVANAFAAYMRSLKDGTAAKGFARPLRNLVSFAVRDPREERPGILRRAVGAAAVGGLAYGGLSYLRGRKAAAPGIIGKMKAGNAANIADARKAGAKIGALFKPRARSFSANLTPAKARELLARLGGELRRNGLDK